MNVPTHLGIIPDGNRRFAKRLMQNPSKGHEWGAEKLRKVLDWCKEAGIRSVTFYALSLENLRKRPKAELDFLLKLAKKEIEEWVENPKSPVHKNRTRVTFFGDLDKLPKDLQEAIARAEKATKGYSGTRLNVALAYGGRQELIHASQRIALQISQGKLTPEQVDEMVLRQNLQTNGNPDPDLIIRTGGEQRISNFLIFQAAYSELAFTDTFWPEFSREEFQAIIRNYSQRQRRFGGQ